MEHLFAFFNASARHLDPKTRFLISVVTKVISGSKRGVRQYVMRALESGARPDEVLDAVLCAYPCAGLTKVVDAMDVILGMGIPGIGLEEAAAAPPRETPAAPAGGPGEAPRSPSTAVAAPSSPQSPSGRAVEEAPGPAGEREWIPAGRLSDLKPGAGARVIVGDRDIALFLVDGEVFAVENRCPHRGGSLSDGTVAGGIVSCPLHGWRYDLRTGRCPERTGVMIRSYPIRREGDQVLVGI